MNLQVVVEQQHILLGQQSATLEKLGALQECILFTLNQKCFTSQTSDSDSAVLHPESFSTTITANGTQQATSVSGSECPSAEGLQELALE